VADVVQETLAYFSSSSPVSITGAFREGDIRHNCADVEKLQATLGFAPRKKFEDGLREFLDWARDQRNDNRDYEQSLAEMRKTRMMHG
jgi:dTDP-L-rhamnose 4-epimerase